MKHFILSIILFIIAAFAIHEILAIIFGMLMALTFLPFGFIALAKYIVYIIAFIILFKIVIYYTKN